jgi:hypothetical protein
LLTGRVLQPLLEANSKKSEAEQWPEQAIRDRVHAEVSGTMRSTAEMPNRKLRQIIREFNGLVLEP